MADNKDTPPAAQVQQEAGVVQRHIVTKHRDGHVSVEDVTVATHPAAGDKVRELVVQWRAEAEALREKPRAERYPKRTLTHCADELEAALAQPQSGDRHAD